MFSEPLILMPVNEWDELKSVFASDLPRSISGLTLLETEEHILESGCDYGFKVYCPFGNANNGIVALNIKHTYYEVIVQCPSDDTKELEEALRNTKIIDWNKCTEVPYAPKHVIECVMKILMEKKRNIDHLSTTDTFFLDKATPPFDIRLSPDLSFKPLTEDHVQMVDDNWPHKYPGSDWYFDMLSKAKLGYGLFRGTDLLSWVFIKEMGALGHLFTLEKHRRKGYGELTLKLISNELLKDSKYVVAFCVRGNLTAANLYTKLGFRCVNELIWCTTDSLESM